MEDFICKNILSMTKRCVNMYIEKCKLNYALLFDKLMTRSAEMNLNMQLMQSINYQCSFPCISNQGNIQF